MEEIWRNIEDYPNYQISSLGRVKSKERYARTHIHNKDGMRKVKEIILKPTQNRRGYLRITLFNKNGRRQCFVHRLVAQAFINNVKNLPAINHKDENSMNNIVSNLEWCNSTYNNNYGNCKRKISEANSIKINQYDMDGNFIKQWLGINNIERCLKINKGNICMCCKGKRNNAGGYKWKYMQELQGSDSDE